MAYLNVKDRVIEAKIVYYGAGLSGKTTNLEKVKARATEGQAGEMMTLETDGDRTLFFDWLPFNVGKFNGCDVKMQLYTVPGQAKYSETRKRVLSSADGVVLVLDSQAAALTKNRECVRDLLDHLKANGLSSEIPLVVQLNKRDLPTAMLAEELLQETGLAGKPYIEACASKGTGVFETLREVTRVVLESVRNQARTRTGDLKSGVQSGLDGKTLYAEIAGANGTAGNGASASAPPSASAPLSSGAPSSKVAEPRPRAAAVVTATRPAPPPSAAPTSAPMSAGPKSAATPTSPTDPPGSSMSAASPAQVNEIIAANRTLARRVDAIETSVVKGVERALADMERRLMARVGEVSAATAELGTQLAASRAEVVELRTQVAASDAASRAESADMRTQLAASSAASRAELRTQLAASDAASRAEGAELRASLTELERKLKEDAAQRTRTVQTAIETATRPLPTVVESFGKTGEALQAVDSAIRVATSLLRDMSAGMTERNGHVETTIFGLNERSNAVEVRLRELTELYADMMTEAKKSKSWFR
jgi:signal recognition particle receptor subunit beta